MTPGPLHHLLGAAAVTLQRVWERVPSQASLCWGGSLAVHCNRSWTDPSICGPRARMRTVTLGDVGPPAWTGCVSLTCAGGMWLPLCWVTELVGGAQAGRATKPLPEGTWRGPAEAGVCPWPRMGDVDLGLMLGDAALLSSPLAGAPSVIPAVSWHGRWVGEIRPQLQEQ